VNSASAPLIWRRWRRRESFDEFQFAYFKFQNVKTRADHAIEICDLRFE
jgi:hypothetical protein